MTTRLTVNLSSRSHSGYVHAIGTEIELVEQLSLNVWMIEIRVPDDTLVGGAWYETFDVYEHEFERS